MGSPGASAKTSILLELNILFEVVALKLKPPLVLFHNLSNPAYNVLLDIRLAMKGVTQFPEPDGGRLKDALKLLPPLVDLSKSP